VDKQPEPQLKIVGFWHATMVRARSYLLNGNGQGRPDGAGGDIAIAVRRNVRSYA